MSGNTLTIVSTVAGIVLAFATSWWFTRSGKRDANAKQESLLGEISTLQEEISTQQEMTSTLQGLLSDVAESVAKPVTSHPGKALEPGFPGHVDNVTAMSPQRATSALDVVVRASLGALLDEHGEVSVARLLRAVTVRLPDASPLLISSSLEQLRNAGRVSWPGHDVMKAGVIRIHPQ